MSINTMVHPCKCLDKTPLIVDGNTDAIYHEACEGFIGDICDMSLTDKFWNEQIADRNKAVIIAGEQYRLGVQYPSKGYGFNGEHYKIKMLETGVILDTADLWHQGKIPKEYKGILQDNAKFVRLIEVKQWNACPNCKQLMNRDSCPFTSCDNSKFKGERIEVRVK